MSQSPFETYFEMSERTGWRTTDLDWDRVDAQALSDFDRQSLLATAVIEHGVPHYSDTWMRVAGLDQEWELWQFAVLWAGEEHRHSFSLKKLADALDVTSDERTWGVKAKGEAFYKMVAESHFGALHKERCPCYKTIAGMLTYTTIQELATWKYYQSWSKKTKSVFLRQLLDLIAKDEAKHHAYYAEALRRYYDKAADKQAYLEAVYEATNAFVMPHLIYPGTVSFFEKTDVIGRLDHLGMKARMAKVFSFSKPLLKRLATESVFAGDTALEPASV